MNAPLKVAGFLATLVGLFGLAFGVGQALEPAGSPPEAGGHSGDHEPASDERAAPDLPGGLLVSQNGFTLVLDQDTAQGGQDVPVGFTITGPDGAPVTSYDVKHDMPLHLVAVRRDFTGFQHVHPELDPTSGAWRTDLDLTPGQWRVYADFTASGGPATTLGADLAVAGTPDLAPPAEDSRTAEVDGYTVTLDGDLTAGGDSELRLTVSKDGRPVTDLEPYLGAYGHLVALREGDLAYLHVHPDGTPGDGTTDAGPDVVFFADVPSEGGYHLFLDFKHEGVVRTAAFRLSTTGTAEPGEHSGGHADH